MKVAEESTGTKNNLNQVAAKEFTSPECQCVTLCSGTVEAAAEALPPGASVNSLDSGIFKDVAKAAA